MAWTNPRTWAAGEDLTAALLNTHVRDNFKAIGDAWQSYTPTWSATTTPPTLGNGTRAGAYIQAGNLIIYRITIVFGSTTAVGSGFYTFTVPVAAAAGASYQPAGTATLLDSSVPAARPQVASFNNSSSQIVLQDTAGTYVAHNAPYAWATNDRIMISGVYEGV